MALRSPLPLTVVTMSVGSLLSSSRKILPIFSAFSANFSSSKIYNDDKKNSRKKRKFRRENKLPATRLILDSSKHRERLILSNLLFRFSSSTQKEPVVEPGHFEVRKSPSRVTRMHFFPQKKLKTFFCTKQRPLTPFHRQNKTNKAVRLSRLSDMGVGKFLCSRGRDR